MSRKLAVFDIDGTLVRISWEGNDACFVRMLRDGFGLGEVNHDWTVYRHATDSAIVADIFAEKRGRPPVAEEIAAMQRALMAEMGAWGAAGNRFVPLPGATTVLGELARRGWAVAIATGNWRDPGWFKLESAGIAAGPVPLASADDAESRDEILGTAIRRAGFGAGSGERVVYLGDRPWDVRAARALGISFVGVGEGESAATLAREGARAVIADFSDFEGVLGILETTPAFTGERTR